VPAGFAAVGLPALQRMAEAGGWAVLDELGYLESGCADFQQSVLDLLKVCRVLAVVRKQDTPFLRALCADPDAFVYDLDCPVPPLGCIVMASGLGRRFGGNKLMAELNGRPLAVHALALAAAPVFAGRIAVTRSAEVEALCRAEGFPVLRHAEPRRSDTVRLGLTALLAQQPGLQGCVFLPGDQPCLTRQTLEALAIGAAPDTIRRPAAPDGTHADTTLTVWSLADSATARLAVNAYKKANPEVDVTFETAVQTDTDDVSAAINDALTQLNTELLAGEGPDVLLLDRVDYTTYINKGMLADMSDTVPLDALQSYRPQTKFSMPFSICLHLLL
jgi:molybdenum cofactor cytidylyltransferase